MRKLHTLMLLKGFNAGVAAQSLNYQESHSGVANNITASSGAKMPSERTRTMVYWIYCWMHLRVGLDILAPKAALATFKNPSWNSASNQCLSV
jgi:hypothetical protein